MEKEWRKNGGSVVKYFKICLVCGKRFEVNDKYDFRKRKFCSRKCGYIGRGTKKSTRKEKVICLNCGKEFLGFINYERKFCYPSRIP